MLASRRGFVLGAAAASVTLRGASMTARAAQTDSRLVLIFLRGAMDGLGVVVPYGDRNLREWRPDLIPPEPSNPNGVIDLGGFWGLHPALHQMARLYRANDMLPIQAVAGPNRSRSHFEAQDMMEVGAEKRLTSGWLNRLAGLLPSNPNCDVGFTMSGHLPLIMLGPTPMTPWDPSHSRPKVSEKFYDNIAGMYADDPIAGAEIADGLKERRFVDKIMTGLSNKDIPPGFPRLAHATARLLAAPDGPRLAELDLDGWDTHTTQLPRLARSLAQLDQGIALLRQGLASVWPQTTIVVLTEFGRTVRVNGTKGTDHGTGTAAFVMGGNVAGGRVLADWPGLARNQLFENRDLQPTLDIRAVAKGVLGPQFGLSSAQLDVVFPDSNTVQPTRGLLRT